MNSANGREMRVYYPKQVRPDAPQNQELEGLVSEVVTHSDEEDLHMRFFGYPYVEAIPARITGRRPDTYEQPRDMVIVAFNQEKPVGYTDITEDAPCEQTAEIAMLVRSDMQRQGFGEAMLKKALEETRKQRIRHLKGYLYQENYKMKQALKKWSEDLHVRVRKEQETGERMGELVYVIDL
jgi:GNAT superfamily N-acetyltransferase